MYCFDYGFTVLRMRLCDEMGITWGLKQCFVGITKVNYSNTHKIGYRSGTILAIQIFQQHVIGESEMDASDILSIMSNISQLYI